MGSILLTGASLGLALGISVGPGVLRLIEVALRGERARAIAVGLGLLATDSSYFSIAALFFDSPRWTGAAATNRIPLAWVSFFVLVAFGISTWRGSPKDETVSASNSIPASAGRSLGSAFASGFFLNLFNPFVPVFWFGAVSYFSVGHSELLRADFRGSMIAFGVSCLGTVFLSDLAKVFLFEKLGSALRTRIPAGLEKFRKAGAILFFFFGLQILASAYFGGAKP